MANLAPVHARGPNRVNLCKVTDSLQHLGITAIFTRVYMNMTLSAGPPVTPMVRRMISETNVVIKNRKTVARVNIS